MRSVSLIRNRLRWRIRFSGKVSLSSEKNSEKGISSMKDGNDLITAIN